MQSEDPTKCMVLSEILSDEAMDHVKKMCGPGYTLDENGKTQPIEPESEGSNTAKGPGFFVQPNALTPGTGVEGFFGDGKLCQDDLAYICKVSLVADLSRSVCCSHPKTPKPNRMHDIVQISDVHFH